MKNSNNNINEKSVWGVIKNLNVTNNFDKHLALKEIRGCGDLNSKKAVFHGSLTEFTGRNEVGQPQIVKLCFYGKNVGSKGMECNVTKGSLSMLANYNNVDGFFFCAPTDILTKIEHQPYWINCKINDKNLTIQASGLPGITPPQISELVSSYSSGFGEVTKLSRTPFEYLCEKYATTKNVNYKILAKYILVEKTPQEVDLPSAVLLGDADIINLFLSKGFKVNTPTDNGKTFVDFVKDNASSMDDLQAYKPAIKAILSSGQTLSSYIAKELSPFIDFFSVDNDGEVQVNGDNTDV